MTYFKLKKFIFIIVTLFIFNSSFAQLYRESFGGTLNIGMVKKNYLQLNPYQAHSSLDQIIHDLSFKGYLFTINANNDVEPVFVSNYKHIDNKTWNFTLKRSLYFQGGKPILSKDIKATLNYLKQYQPLFLNRRLELSNIKKINILGALSFQIVLKKSDKNIIEKLTDIPILPANYIENLMESDLSKRIRILSGSGPYSISQINNYSDIYFKSHKNFYRGRPFLNKIYIKFYDNEQKKISDFIKGKTDLVFFNDYGTAKIINQFTGKNSIIFEVTRKFPKLYVILLNQNTPLFKNKTNRKALEFCINKNTIFTQSIKIQERGFFFAPGSPYANNLINGRKYDPLKAISLLQANGWKMGQQGYVLKKNGMEFNFLLYFDRGSQLQENAVRNIQIQLAEIGINVVPVPINPMDKIKLLQNGTFSAMLMSFPINENNPLPAFSGLYDTFIKKQFSSLNIFGKQIVGLNEQLLTNKISMSRFFNEIHSVFYVNVPMIFLGSQSTQYVAQKSAFKKTRVMYKKNNKIYYYLSPFEDWYLPIDFQR